MTSRLDTQAPSERVRQRRFLLEFGIGMGAYVLLLVVAILLAQTLPDGPGRWALALLPLLPIVWVAIASVRHLRRSDERERANLAQGLSVGFLVAMFSAVALGLLDTFGSPIPHAPWWIWSAGMLAWAVASGAANRRR